MRGFSGLHRFSHLLSWIAFTAKAFGWRSVDYVGTSLHNCNGLRPTSTYCKIHFGPRLRHLSSNIQPGIQWEISSNATLLRKMEIALEDEGVDEAWKAFNNFKRLNGFPKQHLVSKMIISLTYSANPRWLLKAYDLVLEVLEEKPNLLHPDSLTRLALTLIRTQMPVPASTILRVMLEKFKLPSPDICCTLFLHLVKTQIGSYLASEILIEICECYLCRNSNTKDSKETKLISPTTTMFNLVLDSCLRFGSTLKALQLIELIPRVGVVADANSIIIIARIYEMVGQRGELKNLKGHIDGVSSVILSRQYRQFYDSLLSLHLKYNDFDSAGELMLDLYRRQKSLQSSKGLFPRSSGLQNQCLLQIGSSNLRTGCKIMVEPEKLHNDFLLDVRNNSGLVLFMDGKLVPSNKAFAKLIYGYVKERKVDKLSNLLINIQKEMDTKEDSLNSDVMDACIQLGWLETAHDILDGLESAAIPIRGGTYAALLKAYSKENMLEESKLLLKQMRKVGLHVNLFDENAISTCLYGDGAVNPLDSLTATSDDKSRLFVFLDREARGKDYECPLIYEFNASIRFFCKAKMMEDALKTYKRMQQRNIQPTVQTFSHLVNGYSLLKMYRQITILWGDFKKRLEDGVLTADRDLFECLLWNFLRGGYFERVMEVINYMIKYDMYTDKWRYKREFLKYHKDLYRSLKAPNAKTDAQSMRIEYVRSFRRWLGVDHK